MNNMVDTILESVIKYFIPIILASFVGFFIQLRAMKKGLKALLKNGMRMRYYHHMDKGYMDLHDRNEYLEMHESYKCLKGNGVADTMWEELKVLPPKK